MSIDDWARTVWDYHHVGHALEKADCIIVLGSHDTRVAERGAEALLGRQCRVERFPHGVNVSLLGSDLRVQLQTDSRYAAFVGGASPRDVLQGKIWAAQDPARRPSKRQKDLADISRLLEVYPALRIRVPDDILSRLI